MFAESARQQRRKQALATSLMLEACRREPDSTRMHELASLLEDGSERAKFLDCCIRHGVLGLVLSALENASSFSSLGGGPVGELREVLRAQRRRALLLELERDAILRVLQRNGLQPVVLKGAGLASTVFDDVVERNYGDVDLLVPRDRVDDAIASLEQVGFTAPSNEIAAALREHHFHVRITNARGTIVEIHWAITAPHESIALDADAFLREHVVFAAGGKSLRVPRPEHVLLHVVAENARDAFSRLTRLVDVDRIVSRTPAMDWPSLEKMARASGLVHALALVLAMSHRMFGTMVPLDVQRRLRPPVAVRIHLEMLRPASSLLEQRSLRRESWGELVSLWLLAERSRFTTIANMLRPDSGQPLQWLWNGTDSDEFHPPSLGRRASKVGKLIVYQLGTYVVSAPGVRRVSGRGQQWRLW